MNFLLKWKKKKGTFVLKWDFRLFQYGQEKDWGQYLNAKNKVAVPNLEGMTIGEAKKVLKDLNLNLDLNINKKIT